MGLSITDQWIGILYWSKLKLHPGVPTGLRICLENALQDCASMSLCTLTGLYLSGETARMVCEVYGDVVKWHS